MLLILLNILNIALIKIFNLRNVILAGDGNSKIEMNLGGKKINLLSVYHLMIKGNRKSFLGAVWDLDMNF